MHYPKPSQTTFINLKEIFFKTDDKKIFTIFALTLAFSINAQVGNTTIESVLGQTFSQNNEIYCYQIFY